VNKRGVGVVGRASQRGEVVAVGGISFLREEEKNKQDRRPKEKNMDIKREKGRTPPRGSTKREG